MTSLRFDYTTAQETERFREMVHYEDKCRRQFVEHLPETSKKVWRGVAPRDKCTQDLLTYNTEVASPGKRQTVQLFSKKMKHTQEGSGMLPPLTHQMLDNRLIVDVDSKPNLIQYPLSEYVPRGRAVQPAATQTSTPKDSVAYAICQGHLSGIPRPPPVSSGGAITSGGDEPQRQTEEKDAGACSSIFSRGTSSIHTKSSTRRKARDNNCSTVSQKGSSSVGSLTITTPLSVARTSSTQREKVRAMSERLSRMEQKVEASIEEEHQVTQTLEELKSIVLGFVENKDLKRK